MFDESKSIQVGHELLLLSMNVRDTERPGEFFQMWMAEVSRDMLRLGVYFKALGLFLRLPGAGKYRATLLYEDVHGPVHDLMRDTPHNMRMNVLADCLKRLGMAGLMAEVPAGDYWGETLSEPWKALLDRLAKRRGGLLAVIAICLDELVIVPGMARIVAESEQPWWHRMRLKPEE